MSNVEDLFIEQCAWISDVKIVNNSVVKSVVFKSCSSLEKVKIEGEKLTSVEILWCTKMKELAIIGKNVEKMVIFPPTFFFLI